MALSDFTGPTFVDDWSADLDARWPEREQAFQAVVATIGAWAQGGLPVDASPAVVMELGIGAGHLADAVLDVLDSGSAQGAHYVGVDIEVRLIEHNRARLIARRDPERIDFFQVDLNSSDWGSYSEHEAPTVDAAFSLQSLHDLAGMAALTAVYQRLFRVLRPGGLLINADFVVPFPKDDPREPRRFPVDEHRQLLTRTGYVEFSHSRHGDLACMSVRKPNTEGNSQ